VADDADDVLMLPAEVPVGWFVFDTGTRVWVEVTRKPETFWGITVLSVIDGYDVPLMYDEDKKIKVCRGIRVQ